MVGEKLTYELGRGKNGKPQATNVQRQAIGQWSERTRDVRPKAKKSPSRAVRHVGFLLLVVLGVYGFTQYQSRTAVRVQQLESLTSQPKEGTITEVKASGFTCDGRTHCSQMTSCTEAKLFLKNCPGTEMDGNSDGTPCEQQWCTSPFAK
jgi:hypothetical protein